MNRIPQRTLPFAFPLALALAALLAPAAPADATQFRKVLADTLRETDPTPSPDGKWLAFTMAKGGGVLTNIWVMPIGGDDARQVTNEPDSARAMTPTWSADSKSLLYVSTRDRQYNVYSIPLAGGTATKLTQGTGSHRFASRSPDGMKIVFPSNRLQATSIYGYNLYLMGPDGESSAHPAQKLTNLDGSPGHPVWSPDGKWIGFVSKDVDTTKTVTIGPGMQSKKNAMFATFRVFKISAEGGKPIQITGLTPAEDRDEDVWPSWSPDGKWIAVAKRIGTKNDVWLVDPDGKRPSVKVTSGGNCSKPTWSADGREIWYTTSEKGNDDIWVASDISIPPAPPPAKKAPTFKPVPAKRTPATASPAKKGTTKSRATTSGTKR